MLNGTRSARDTPFSFAPRPIHLASSLGQFEAAPSFFQIPHRLHPGYQSNLWRLAGPKPSARPRRTPFPVASSPRTRSHLRSKSTPPICCAGCQFHPVTHRTNLSSPPHPNILSTRRFLIHSPGVPPLQTAARIMTLKERSYAEVNQISPYPADSCG